jgi:dihydrofolate reductase
MAKVILDVSMSLDGFAAGPNVRPEEPMGDGGEDLHTWREGGEIDARVNQDLDGAIGAVVIGRRTFDLGQKPWGGTPWPGTPSFVVTHRPQEELQADNGGTFAFDGLENAVQRAKEAAGDKVVMVLGPDISRQMLVAGMIDEVRLHIAPILLGGGTPLFDGEVVDLIPDGPQVTGTAAHFRFRVGNARD